MNSNQNNRGRLNPAMEEAIARALGKNKPKAVETQAQQSENVKETKMETNVNKEVNTELTNGTSSETDKVLPDTLSQDTEAGVDGKPLSVEVEEQLDTVLENLVTEEVANTETQSQQETVPEQETAQPQTKAQTKEDKMKDEIMKQYPGISLDTVEEIIFIRESVNAGKISQEEIVAEMKHLVTKRGDLNIAAIFEEYKSHLTVEGWSILKNKCEGMADVADEVKEAIKTNYINKAKAIAPWVIGGAAVAGAGYLAYKYFSSQSEAEGIVTAVMGEGAEEVASGVADAIAGYFA